MGTKNQPDEQKDTAGAIDLASIVQSAVTETLKAIVPTLASQQEATLERAFAKFGEAAAKAQQQPTGPAPRKPVAERLAEMLADTEDAEALDRALKTIGGEVDETQNYTRQEIAALKAHIQAQDQRIGYLMGNEGSRVAKSAMDRDIDAAGLPPEARPLLEKVWKEANAAAIASGRRLDFESTIEDIKPAFAALSKAAVDRAQAKPAPEYIAPDTGKVRADVDLDDESVRVGALEEILDRFQEQAEA